MTKTYILTKENLQDLINNSFNFFSEKAKRCMEQNRVPMFSDRLKWIDEFLEMNLIEIGINKLQDELDNGGSSYIGKNLKEIEQALRAENITPDQVRLDQEKIKKFMEERP
jgi:hypothetical protein